MIRLYDTTRRDKVELEPLEEGKVGVYVCGPTVYDLCHVGHARCYVAFDVVVRHLRSRGFATTYVRNITDVDDKIIQRAAERDEDPLALSARFSDSFIADMTALGNVAPDHEPRVSDHITQIIELIEQIIAGGFAYEIEGDVYFEVNTYQEYGDLSRRNLEDLRAGARVDVDRRKRNPIDFALWKTAKPGEVSWDSPWGPGRPGWHIECSAMSSTYLGAAFDIHGGGMDLIFPHHENEIAQSRSVGGPASHARHWMHNGFINVRKTAGDGEAGEEGEEEKMSKSLGNFFTIKDVLERHEAEALRLFLLGTQYRKPLTFEVDASDDGVRYASLEDAERRLAYTYSTLSRVDLALSVGKKPGECQVLAPADDFVERFDAALDDDFNTAAALGLTSELLTLANKLLDQPRGTPKNVRRRTLQKIRDSLTHAGQVLGIYQEAPEAFLSRRRDKLCAQRGVDPIEVERLIAARAGARKRKDFEGADAIRQQLTDLGVEVMDSAGASAWRIAE